LRNALDSSLFNFGVAVIGLAIMHDSLLSLSLENALDGYRWYCSSALPVYYTTAVKLFLKISSFFLKTLKKSIKKGYRASPYLRLLNVLK
jgi:hypothetical protein